MSFILTSPMFSPVNTIISPYYSIVTVDTPGSTGPIYVDSPYSPGMILLDSPSLLSPSYLDIPVVSIEGYPYSTSSNFIYSVDPYSPTVTDILIDSPMMYDSPYVSSIDLTYSMPLVGVYENPNQDPDLIRRMTEYYYFKMLDDWLYNSMREVLEYLDIKGSSRDVDVDGDRDVRTMSRGKASKSRSKSKKRKQHGGEMTVIPRKTASTKDNDTTDTVEIKARYIQKHVFSKESMRKFLSTFIREYRINWYDIPKKERALRMDLEDELIKRIKQKAGVKDEDL